MSQELTTNNLIATPASPERRDFLRLFTLAAMGTALTASSSCSLLPTAPHSDPRVRACLDLIDNILNIAASSGVYGMSVKSEPPVLFQQFLPEASILVPNDQIPLSLIALVIAIEDPIFFLHDGANLNKLISAGFSHLLERRAQDSSTLTQQIARNAPGSVPNELWIKAQSLSGFEKRQLEERRKMEEIALARAIEMAYSKETLAKVFPNLPYLGQGADTQLRGFQAAGWFYFRKVSPESLTLAQKAHLVGMLHNPRLEAPSIDGERGKTRRLEVLDNLLEFKTLLSVQLEYGLILDRDRDFAKALFEAIDPSEIKKAREDGETPRLVAESPITAPVAVKAIEYLRQTSHHPLKDSPEPSIFTRVETTLVTEAQRILVSALLDLSNRENKAPATGIIVNKAGDVIALAALRSNNQQPFNLSLNCGYMLWPLRALVEMNEGRAPRTPANFRAGTEAKANLRRIIKALRSRIKVKATYEGKSSADGDDLDAEIKHLEKHPDIWGKLREVLSMVRTCDPNFQEVLLETPANLRNLNLSAAEITRLYLLLIRTTADIPSHLRLISKMQNVYSGESLKLDKVRKPLIRTGIYSLESAQMLALIREASLPPKQPKLKSDASLDAVEAEAPVTITLNRDSNNGLIATLGLTQEHICFLTVGVNTKDSKMPRLKGNDLVSDCSTVLRRVEALYAGEGEHQLGVSLNGSRKTV